MHTPSAHVSPEPQLWPLGSYSFAGQAPDVPVHISAMSHCGSAEARHTVCALANWHESVQHASFVGSQTDPEVNWHVLESQQVEFTFGPGSHSSPASTIPLPHILRVIVLTLELGSTRQDVLTALEDVDCMTEQMLPKLHCEKTFCTDEVTGDMIYWSFASQVLVVRGQQTGLFVPVELHPSWQSWIAPKL